MDSNVEDVEDSGGSGSSGSSGSGGDGKCDETTNSRGADSDFEVGSGGVPVFRPSMAEFADFSKYVEYMETRGAHKIGLAKIVPPKEWTARKSGYEGAQLDEFRIRSPIIQRVEGKEGIYTSYNITQRSLRVSEFRDMANQAKYATPAHANYDELERKYWKNLTFIPAWYGADVSGSFTDIDQPHWNCNHLGTILDDLYDDAGLKIEGVNTAYLYFGMWKSTFAWVLLAHSNSFSPFLSHGYQ